MKSIKLIDMNELIEEIECRCPSDCETEKVIECIKEAPIIDAMPIGWLCQKMWEEEKYGNVYRTDYLNSLIWEWHHGKIDNSNKSGVWIPLERRIGLYNHPWWAEFKCSLCGYETYTVLDSPSKICRMCGAKMDTETIRSYQEENKNETN